MSKKRTQGMSEVSDDLLCALMPSDRVTADQALNIPAFSGSISLIASTIASLPVLLYKEDDGKTEPVTDPRVTFLNDDTGDIMDGVQFKTALVRDYLIHGEGYAYINRSGNDVQSLHYVPFERISKQKGTEPIFKQAKILIDGKSYEHWQFIKILRNTKDGISGTGLLTESGLALTSYYNLLKYEKVLVMSGGNKKGFLEAEKKLDKDAIDALKAAWRKLYSNPTPDAIVLNNGTKFHEAGQTGVEMQLGEMKQSNAKDICKTCGIPSTLYDGAANDDVWQMFIKTAITPIIKALEAALNKDLLLIRERSTMYFAFDTKELMRGDMLKRYQAYDIALKSGFLQVDEVRYNEDYAPLGLKFIRLGLSDVLYDPETGEIYTPNTDKLSTMSKSPLRSDKEE